MKILITIMLGFMCTATINLEAQEAKVKRLELSGTVKNYNNKPIKGVRIFVDSLKTSVKTDKNGVYNITLTNKNKLITAFSRKHGLIDLNYNGENKINFIFPKEQEIITSKKFYEMGYGLSNYDNNSIDYSSYRDIYQLLRTKFQNVEIRGEDITIKGAGASLSTTNPYIKPIFVVNGSQVSSIAQINPADIKTISVDRPKSSIYGSRGAGGVIEIILK